jgi:hypothetical protein
MAPSRRRAIQWAGFQSVLCRVDFSENSGLALRYAEPRGSRQRDAGDHGIGRLRW